MRKTFQWVLPVLGLLLPFVTSDARGDAGGAVDSEILRMSESGGVYLGTNADLGNYVLIVAVTEVSESKDLELVKRVLQLNARRDLAGFLGVAISEHKEVTTEHSVSTQGGERVESSTEGFRSEIRSEINQAFSGASLHSFSVTGSNAVCAYVISEKSQKVARSLRVVGTRRSDEVSSADHPIAVRSMGMSAVTGGDVVKARSAALESGKREAVEQAFGVAVLSSTSLRSLDPGTLQNSEISHSFGSVDRYSIAWETNSAGIYQVVLDAIVSQSMSIDKVMAFFQSAGAVFYLDPVAGDVEKMKVVRKHFEEFFKELNFRLTLVQAEADYTIRISSEFLQKTHPTTRRALTQLQLSLIVFEGAGTRVHMSINNNPPESVSDLQDEGRRLDVVTKKALNQIRDSVISRFGELAIQSLRNGRPVTVEFMGAKNVEGAGYSFVAQVLKETPGISGLTRKSNAETGLVVFEAHYVGSLSPLQEVLSAELKKRTGQRPKLRSLKANVITYEYLENR